MKHIKKAILTLSVLVFAAALAACGSSAAPASQDQTTVAAAGESTVQTETQSGAETQVQAETTAAAADQTTAAETTQEALTIQAETGKVDDLLGDWVDVKDPSRFAKITKNGDKYQYEDNDGKYEAAYDSGMMGVKVNETDIADVYIDTATKNLVLDFQGDITKFKRK